MKNDSSAIQIRFFNVKNFSPNYINKIIDETKKIITDASKKQISFKLN